MNVWPVLAREVRQATRQPATYRSRLAGAMAVLAAGCVFGILVGDFGPGKGGRVFAWLQMTVFLSTWILVPFIAADCLSRERREGTLGLLFLTPLRPLDIVLAKLSLHAMRGFMLWLAAIPVFTIPMLIGGVSWQQAGSAFLINFSALMLSLSASVLASAFSKKWSQSVIWSFLFGFCLLVFWLHFMGFMLVTSLHSVIGNFSWRPSTTDTMRLGFHLVADWAGLVRGLLFPGSAKATAVTNLLLGLLIFVSCVCVLVLLIACSVASWITRRNWREEPPSQLRVKIERRFTTPVLGEGLLKRWLRRTLDRNPVGWLERRSWSGRLIMFGWLAIVIGVFSGLIPQVNFWRFNMRRYDLDIIDILLAQPLLLSMVAAAAGSFRRERETGVLELLLVSPLNVSAIVWGRIRGLYAQFMPSVILVLAGWIFLLTLLPDRGADQFFPVFRFAAWSVAIPCIGLYASLSTRNFLAAILLSVLVGWGGPWLFMVGWNLVRFGMSLGIRNGRMPYSLSVFPALICLMVAGASVQLMIMRLHQRRFEFNREVT